MKVDWGKVNNMYYWFDFDSCDSDGQFDYYCDTVEMLEKYGLEFTECNVEHDCISGFLKRKEL